MITIPEEVTALLQSGNALKNVRIHFPNGERADITNDYHLLEGTFKFTEQICSQNTLKFGLCEANIIEFQCIDIENIEGCEIAVYHEIDISSQAEEFIAEYGMTSEDVSYPYYRIPYGIFIVKECQRQADVRIRSVVAYSKIVYRRSTFSAIEKAKMKVGVSVNKPYTINLHKFILSNVPDMNIDGDYKEVEEYTTTDFAYYCTNLSLRYEIVVIQGVNRYEFADVSYSETALSPTELYLLEYGGGRAIETKINEIIERLEPYIKYIDRVESFKRIIRLYMSNRLEWNGGSSGDVRIIGRLEDTILYPYISNFFNAESYFMVFIPNCPLVVTVKDVSTGETVESFEVEYAGMGKISYIDVGELNELQNMELSFPRSKEGTYYRCPQIEAEFIDLLESYLEINGLLGKESRFGGINFFEIGNNFGLYPSETLYPSSELYPKDANAGNVYLSQYISAQYVDKYTRPYGRVSVTYTNENEEKIDTYYAIVDESASDYDESHYQTYSLSDNYLIKNYLFSADMIEQILEQVAERIANVQYMPATVKMVGRPDIEIGDVIRVITSDGGFETFVLKRVLSGEQALFDNIESRG